MKKKQTKPRKKRNEVQSVHQQLETIGQRLGELRKQGKDVFALTMLYRDTVSQTLVLEHHASKAMAEQVAKNIKQLSQELKEQEQEPVQNIRKEYYQ